MSEPGFASLGPSLLARKGGAKPAMRPQVAPLVTDQSAVPEDQLEDLGWNDMGHEADLPGSAQIVPINADVAADAFVAGAGPIVRRQQRRLEERVLADAAMTGAHEYDEDEDEDEDADFDAASLYDTQDYADEDEDQDADDDGAIYSPLAPHMPVAAPAPMTATAPRPAMRPRVPAAQAGRRAAFTLRLDADRHLKLRLAATMQGVSAQALVTEALDRLLAEHDELEVIANHLKRH
jgi:hypothetical protein